MVLQRILAALRHLASQGRLVRHPLMQAAVNFVSVGLEQARCVVLGCCSPPLRAGVLQGPLACWGAAASLCVLGCCRGPLRAGVLQPPLACWCAAGRPCIGHQLARGAAECLPMLRPSVHVPHRPSLP